MCDSNYIHIALLGPVSAGKTTLLNALLVARYGDMAMKRTTMAEAIYYESSDEKLTSAADIHAKNTEVNSRLYEKAKSGGLTAVDLKPIEHFVSPVYDLLLGKLHGGARLAIHDLPGLNDAQTKIMYHDYVAANFHKYNIVILVLDVNSGMNTSDEKDILTLIINRMKTNKAMYGNETSLIIAINKCDDMEVKDHNSSETVVTDPGYATMIKQVRATVESTVRSCGSTSSIPIRIICIAAEDAYIYRMYSRNPECVIDPKHRNKFGINAFGKLTWAKMTEADKNFNFQLKVREKNADAVELAGFRHLDWKLAQVLTKEMQYQFLIAPLKVRMAAIVFDRELIEVVLDERVRADMVKFTAIKSELRNIAAMFGKSDAEMFFARHFDSYLTKYEKMREPFMVRMATPRGLVDYQVLKNLFLTMSTVRLDMASWLLIPRTGKLNIIAANINSINIAILMKTGENTPLTIHDQIGRIIFPDHGFDLSLLTLLAYVSDEAKNDLGFYWSASTNVEVISVEVCSMLWRSDSISWRGKISVINDLLKSRPAEFRIKLILRNICRYLESNLIGDQRFDTLEVYSGFYINSDLMAGGLGFGSRDIATIKKYLRAPPTSARVAAVSTQPVAHIPDSADIQYAVRRIVCVD